MIKFKYDRANIDMSLPQYDTLNKEQELEIFKRYNNEKDINRKEKIRNEIVERNFKYISYVLNKEFHNIIYYRRNLKYDHLFNLAVEGMINAIDKFDYSKGSRFVNYSIFYIRKSIYDDLYKTSGMLSKTTRIFAYENMINKLKYKNPKITEKEIMKKLNISKYFYDSITRVITNQKNTVYLDSQISTSKDNDSGVRSRKQSEIFNFYNEDEQKMYESVYNKDLKEIVNKIFNDHYIFPDNEKGKIQKDYFIEYFYNNKSYEAIGKKYGKTKQSVNRIVHIKLEMIRKKYGKELLNYI